MKRLTKKQVTILHEMLTAETGGSSEIRDSGFLDSAVNSPFQTFGDEELTDIIMKIAGSEKSEDDLLSWLNEHNNN